ncbi:bacteriochlorophyll 4-vinyl reductase [Avibacterium paragallinarum]|uniref:Uncharacterized protein n=1 Tax=Avibacterium paragallinarum TaxID=728 RepID=A0A380X206_AVIPA|nr:bacteriochlorophyll 4-vinyl reductase [Avibacterium paragallinarum]KAA6208237.1 bacteriochlorophyll 4-vinyl reductase [Avibacterium paragallinarum]RZN58772.1 bacteriochlorophyll 4-vinyl reductase [Avibacterium paragallinarum]RZN68960.1 bacteriochlorophyll 4-vinyl reductase [Avibacterium paragallinarum]SUU97160.1 Uncharacterised protein [Avibacterium paragallinarum]
MSNNNTALEIVNAALKFPMIKVNRQSFLLETCPVRSNEERNLLLEKGPIGSGLFSEKEIRKIAENICSKKTWTSTTASFAAGIPGGFAMIGTIPADTAQFFGFALRLAQEIAYLYDTRDFWDGETLNDEAIKGEFMLYLGTMLGVGGAANAMRYITQGLSQQLAKNLTKTALTKTFWYPLIKSLGKYVGVKITKDTFARTTSKIVPFLGGVFSGALTYYAMTQMNKRLINALEKRIVYTEEEKRKDKEVIKKEMPEVYEAIFEEIEDTH